MNILYRGVDNPVEVAVPGVPCKDLQVEITNGEISGSGCLYTIKPGRDYNTWLMATWSVPHGTDSAETLFHVRNLPLPQAYFAGSWVDYDSIPASHAKAAQGVLARMFDVEINIPLKVIYYRLQLLRNCSFIFDGSTNEARLSARMTDILSTAEPSDVIMISDIQVRFPDSTVKEILPLHLYLR